MKRVAALRGVRFEVSRIGSLDGVLAPPYDVVTQSLVRDYLARSPYNVLQLDLGIADPSEAKPGRWPQVAHRYRKWLEDGVLRPDETPSLYVMRHRYVLPGGAGDRTVMAVFAGLRAGPGGERGALGHERTVAAVRQERLKALRSCQAQFSPILALVGDPDGRLSSALEQAASGEPATQAEAPAGGEIALWVHPAGSEQGRSVLDALASDLDRSPAIIADGHHRYEAAGDYVEERARAGELRPDGSAAEPFALAGMVPLEGGGLSILPVHRIVGPAGREVREALRFSLYEHFIPLSEPELPPPLRDLCRRGEHDALLAAEAVAGLRKALNRTVLGVWWRTGQVEWLAVPAKASRRGSQPRGDPPGAAGDISILHRGALHGWQPAVDAQGASPGGTAGRWVRYTSYPREAARAVDEGDAAAAILLAPVELSEVQEVALAGKKMPEKSTYFYPKLTSGLVLHDLRLPVQTWPPG